MSDTDKPSGPNADKSPEPAGDAIPAAVASHKKGFSPVWIVPITAVLLGGFLVFKACSETGPTIKITFATAEGLAAGKTKIKYKDIDVGTVTDVEFNEDLSGVVVTAEMQPNAERYLTANTRFWVVRARLSAGEVSGLGTVFSGAYLGIDPSIEGKSQRSFVGLERPPPVTRGEQGKRFVLKSAGNKANVGAPIFFRGTKVGRVISRELDPNGLFVTTTAFVAAPHDIRVTTTTRFWDAGGVNVEVSSDGVSIDSPSLTSMLVGGISFDVPEGDPQGEQAEENAEFTLFENRKKSKEKTFAIEPRFVLYFKGAIGHLKTGSPVSFNGFVIGEVDTVKLIFDRASQRFSAPVVIKLQPGRIEVINSPTMPMEERMEMLVKRGLRGKLVTKNLLTGALAVSLEFHAKAKPPIPTPNAPFPEIPTIGGSLDEITASVAGLLSRIEKVPIEAMARDAARAMKSLDSLLSQAERTVADLDRTVATDLAKTLKTAEKTLRSVDKTMASADKTLRNVDASGISSELRKLLVELTQTARSLRLMADYVEQHPEALLRGKK